MEIQFGRSRVRALIYSRFTISQQACFPDLRLCSEFVLALNEGVRDWWRAILCYNKEKKENKKKLQEP